MNKRKTKLYMKSQESTNTYTELHENCWQLARGAYEHADTHRHTCYTHLKHLLSISLSISLSLSLSIEC